MLASEYAVELDRAYKEGFWDGYTKARLEFLFGDEGAEDEPWWDLEEEPLSIADLIFIEKVRQDYARNRDYFSIGGVRLG
jgi:hypothetical protein